MTRTIGGIDRALAAILAAALALRVAVAFWPVIHHADELWQYLETAYHLGVGPWVRTWEAREGTRGWLLPMLLAGPVALGHALAPTTLLDIILPRIVCALLSLALVACAWGLGAKVSRAHAIIAALVAATWFEIAYFAPRTLSEPVATSLLVIAWWLSTAEAARRRYWLIGLLLGLVAVFRLQYAPAALTLALFAAGLWPRAWLALVGGGLVALAIGGVADLLAGAPPLAWAWRSVSANLVANRSADYGVSPWWSYARLLFAVWGWGLLPILGAAAVGARRYPAALAVALVTIAVHSLIPHKEYRFILLATTLLVILAAIGSVDLVQRYWARPRTTRQLGLAWILLSVLCGGLGAASREWGNSARLITAWRIASDQSGVCGVAVYRPPEPLIASYALYRHDTPIYQYDDVNFADAAQSRAFTVVLAPRDRFPEITGYQLVACPQGRTELCVFAREGACRPTSRDAASTVDRVHARRNM